MLVGDEKEKICHPSRSFGLVITSGSIMVAGRLLIKVMCYVTRHKLDFFDGDVKRPL